MLTLVTALPLFNQMLLASLNPSLAHVRGVRVHLLEYVFVLLLTILTVACVKIVGAVLVEALLLIPAAAARNLNRSARGFVLWSIAFSTVACLVGIYAPMRWDLPLAVRRGDHPCGRHDLRRHARPAHGVAALSRGQPMTLNRIGILVCCVAAAWLEQAGRRGRRSAAARADGHAGDVLVDRSLSGRHADSGAERAGRGRQLTLLKDYIERRTDTLAPTFAAATAVVTLTNALPGDPLYRFAREANIRIVDIEAAVPWSIDAPGVALADAPSSNVEWGGDRTPTRPSRRISGSACRTRFAWATSSRAILPRCFRIRPRRSVSNLEGLKRSLLDLRGDYQDRLIASGADVVFALTGDFVYLTNDMGLFVDGYFIKQDVRWTDADLAMLTQHLRDHDIKVVLHEWEPSEAIQNAVRSAGAKLVVLDAGDPGVVVDRALAPDGLQQILRKNLDAIVVAAGE